MKLLYWQPVSEQFKETLPASGKIIEGHLQRKLKSDHPSVDEVWFWGGFSPTKNVAVCYLEILLKDETRKSIKIEPEQMESLDIPEAIEFLQSLKINEQ